MLSGLAIEQRKAAFSKDKKYRYALERKWSIGTNVVCFIGLNPSIADEYIDDPTITRLTHFAKNLWGFDSFYIVNLFAYRSTDPTRLLEVKDPIGPENDGWIRKLVDRSVMVVAMWGNSGKLNQRNLRVLEDLKDRVIYCFGTTLDLHPKHPVRLGYNTELEIYSDRTNEK